jgi:hypothetical protein
MGEKEISFVFLELKNNYSVESGPLNEGLIE